MLQLLANYELNPIIYNLFVPLSRKLLIRATKKATIYNEQDYKTGSIFRRHSDKISIENKIKMTIFFNNTEPKRGEAERQILLEIMQGLSSSNNLPEFLTLVHVSIAKVIYAENFFIVFYNKDTNLFEEVYSVDQYDPPAPPSKLGKSVSAYVFRTGQPLLLTQDRFNQLATKGEVQLIGTRSPSWLGIPLKNANETIGVMVVQDYEWSNRYSEHDKDFLASIAGQVAMAIERKQVEAALHRSVEESKRSQILLFALNNVIQAVQRAHTAEEVYREIGVGMSSLNYRVWVLELKEDKKGLSITYTNSSSKMVNTLEKFTGLSARKYRIPLNSGNILQEVIQSSKTMCMAVNNQEIAKFLPAALRPLAGGIAKTLDTNYFICAPLITRNTARGLIAVNGSDLSPLDVPAITTFAAQASIALENAELYERVQRELAERKVAEEALRQSEERYKLLAWATKDAVWDWDLRTHQVWWGEGLRKILHYSSEMTQTNSEWWFDHIHPDDKAKVNRVIVQALEGGMEFWSKEYRFQRKDGTYANIMDRGYIMRDNEGKAYRMIGAMLDITERKYMESTLMQANEQMGQFLNELQRRNSEIVLLNEMSRLLQACQSAKEAYQIIVDLSRQLFPRTSGAVYMINAGRTLVNAVASWGELPPSSRIFSPHDCWALGRGQTRFLAEDQAETSCLHLGEPLPTISYCLPMQVQGETVGILHVQSQHKEYLDEAKRQLAYTVVEQTSLALSNIKLREALREQSIRDPLTGLYNRRYMEEALKQQLSRATRQLHPMGIIMIDIDHFKSFNDTYGHAAGDALLHELGQFLQSHIRGEDIACRYGGEEFILIMPDASLEAAQQRAEHLRNEIRQMQVQNTVQSYRAITLSIGVAIYPLHGLTIDAVLHAADVALYRAKKEGRDRVVVTE
jgi:diguanylate cyclase (GGDEF)-like protein/PAS domain S-box-containing protein